MTAEQQRVAQIDQRITAARARVEQMGGALHIIDRGAAKPVFLVSRWTLTKELDGVEAVEAWLGQVEARA